MYLKSENLRFDESTGRYGLVDVKGKGGRLRDCPIISVGEKSVDTNANANANVNVNVNATSDIGVSVRSDTSVNVDSKIIVDSSASMSTSINANTNEVTNRVVERMQNTSAGQLVWGKVPTRADIHSYRADYCKTIRNLHARPIDEIPKKERYYCRGDRKGVVYDRRAMAVASRALGHNRIGVIAGHYLYERAKWQVASECK